MPLRRAPSAGMLCGLALAAALCLSLVPDAEGQARRRLQSRAAFAELDSVELADSSEMRPLRPTGAQDSVLLDMLAFLDGSVGGPHGVRGTRIRKWDGFGSQAHPRLGILVDSLEVAEFLAEVMNQKGAAGVPRDTAEARLPYVLRFLVAHEYAHLLQYQVFGKAFMEDPDSTRVIECGADLLGGINFWAFTKSSTAGQPPRIALETARDFGYIVGSDDWLDGTQHPLRENRRRCIEAGIATAGLLDSLPRGPEVIHWSRKRAHALVAVGGGVVGGSQELAVIRDSSVSRLVRTLAAAAVKGPEALRAHRVGPAPGTGTSFLLRNSLEPPWECTARERLKAEESTCVQDLRTTPYEAFAGLVRQVEEGLAGAGWTRATSRASSPAGDGKVVFMHGGRPDDLVHPQVTLTLTKSEDSPAVQLPTSYLLSMTVRSARTR